MTPPDVPIGTAPVPLLPEDSSARLLFPASIGQPDRHGLLERRAAWSWQDWSFDDTALPYELGSRLDAVTDPAIVDELAAEVHRWVQGAPDELAFQSPVLPGTIDTRLVVRLLGWRVVDSTPGVADGLTQFDVRAVLGLRVTGTSNAATREDQVFELDGHLRVPSVLTQRPDLQTDVPETPEIVVENWMTTSVADHFGERTTSRTSDARPPRSCHGPGRAPGLPGADPVGGRYGNPSADIAPGDDAGRSGTSAGHDLEPVLRADPDEPTRRVVRAANQRPSSATPGRTSMWSALWNRPEDAGAAPLQIRGIEVMVAVWVEDESQGATAVVRA